MRMKKIKKQQKIEADAKAKQDLLEDDT